MLQSTPEAPKGREQVKIEQTPHIKLQTHKKRKKKKYNRGTALKRSAGKLLGP